MIDEYVKKWLIKANNDLKASEHELNIQDDPVTDAICFHSQQAVEKYLKAYLIVKEVEFAQVHTIAYLLKLCKVKDKKFEELNDTKKLTRYAVAGRYPDNFIIPSLQEAKDAVKKARKVKKFLYSKLQITDDDIKLNNSTEKNSKE